ncbi:NADH dehydrogenase [ubiquinone] iron-sulfur protein 4, mitochondrial [Leptopilina heterotoma]|uniref:NADH dehydrogenase [ubiquinone] iron-sulfur protein 4, mitochondrial n=1 Tax=Leptopilina heterotoma TaxID=63436 RepID=UPI001CA953DC|nr:NADH dehydrogenase [ubiquinone] iron-sulfur protein 4, mitochondrial [Leptopilina heterotoma]
MASHLLVMTTRVVNNLRNINQLGLYKHLSTSNLRYTLNAEENAKLKEPEQKDPKIVLQDPLELQQQEALHGYITVTTEENVGIVSGVPEEHIKNRTVRIYQPAKNAMQSGTNNTNFWQIEFETRERWENPLMGWTSTGDPMSNVKVDFETKEEAMQHCKKMGWQFSVQKSSDDQPKQRTYGTNFSWNRRTRVTTK